MTATADASFLVSLYGRDIHTPAARAWMVAHATPVILTPPLLVKSNALSSLCSQVGGFRDGLGLS